MEKTTLALLSGWLLLSPALCAQQEFRYEVRHRRGAWALPAHIKKAGIMGALTITGSGISFEEKYAGGEAPKHSHSWRWDYRDIEQLKIAPKSLIVLTYQSDKWKLGADRQYEFELVSEGTFRDVYPLLKNLLDQRFIAAVVEPPANMLWEIPVKHLLRFGGDQGVLRVGADVIVYSSDKQGESRTWRYEDIENISSSAPFQLTVTTFERARTHYGNLKGFNFELKERLEETRYNDLWLRLNRAKGMKILDSYREAGGA